MNNYTTEFAYKVFDGITVHVYGCLCDPLVIARTAFKIIGLHDDKARIIDASSIANRISFESIVKTIMVNGQMIPTLMINAYYLRLFANATSRPAAKELADWVESFNINIKLKLCKSGTNDLANWVRDSMQQPLFADIPAAIPVVAQAVIPAAIPVVAQPTAQAVELSNNRYLISENELNISENELKISKNNIKIFANRQALSEMMKTATNWLR